MTLFVSYSSKDEVAVRELVSDLERARQTVWLDQELRGGDPWWQDILKQIRECRVFLFALSANALASKPCRAELAYARALGLPILPVQIGPVENLRTAPISEIQIVDYRERTAVSGMSLVAAIQEFSAQRRELPDPLPEPPPVPFEYLLRLGSAIERAQLSPDEQGELIRQLRECLETEDDDGVRDDARGLLRALRRRPDVTYRNASDIDALLATSADGLIHSQAPAQQPEHRPTPEPEPGGPPPGWYPDPSGADQRRYWDGQRWTDHVGASEQVAGGTGQPDHAAAFASAPTPNFGPTGPSVKAPGSPFSIAAYVLGGIAVLFFPIIFGPAAIICGVVARTKNEPQANIGLAVAIGGTVLGFILSAIVASST
jgi:hypothetical protein